MRDRRLLPMLGLLSGLLSAGYGVMFTLLDDFRSRYAIGASALGAVVAVGFFSSFAAQVLLAPYADRGQARRFVLLGLALSVGGLLALAFGTTAMVLGAGRLTMGLGAGTATPAIRRIVILADPDRLGHNLGRLFAAEVGGFACGPALSAVLVGPFGLAAPFLVIAALTVACLPAIARTRVEERATGADSTAAPAARFAFDLVHERRYVAALCLGMAAYLMVGTFDALWVLVLDDLHTATWIANLGITLFALPLVVLGPVGGRLAQRVGPFRLGALGLVVGATFMFSYGRWSSGVVMFAVAMVHAFGDGLSFSSAGIAVGMVAPNERQAGAQGLLGGAQTLVGGIAALVAGQLYQHDGRAMAYAACAIAMGLLVVVAMALVRDAGGDAQAAVAADSRLSEAPR